MDGDGGEEEQQVEHGQGHQQPVERVLPQLRLTIEADGRSQTNTLSLSEMFFSFMCMLCNNCFKVVLRKVDFAATDNREEREDLGGEEDEDGEDVAQKSK